jgi:glycosyltransferase involved in cell wall biosynthesis
MAETVRLGAAYPQYKRKFVYLGNGVACGDGPGYWETREARPADFLFVGNTTWKKNLCHAAGVFFLVKKRAPGARLTVVGAGEDVAANHRMGLDGEGIVVIPSVPLDAMGAWYRACPYLLVTSRYEGGHSLAMLEAMTCGCLVFASAIQSNREIVTDGINGVIISGFDAAADADRICTALGSQGQSAMRHEAVETARKHGWESRVLDLEGLLWSR